MSKFSALMAAFSGELSDISMRLIHLQNVPLLQTETGDTLEGEDLLRAMMALQDLDRLAQTTAALSAFAGRLADVARIEATEDALRAMDMQSVAERLRHRLGDPAAG